MLAASLGFGPAGRTEASGMGTARHAAVAHRLEAAGVPSESLRVALRAFTCGQARGAFETPVLTLVDYSLPSTERRLWVLDLEAGSVLFHELVAHGRESGLHLARRFSNVPDSRQSSLGLFRTGETYLGRHGYSMRLIGLEPGTNDRAAERAIVVHGADYATPEFVQRHGRLGRSWGCPTLDPAVNRAVIDTIQSGTALLAYYPEAKWLARSPFLHCDAPPSDAGFFTKPLEGHRRGSPALAAKNPLALLERLE